MVFWVKFPLRRNIVAQESWPQPTLASSFFEFCQPPWYWKNQQSTAGASPVTPSLIPLHIVELHHLPQGRPHHRQGLAHLLDIYIEVHPRSLVSLNTGLLAAEVTNSRGCHRRQRIWRWGGQRSPVAAPTYVSLYKHWNLRGTLVTGSWEQLWHYIIEIDAINHLGKQNSADEPALQAKVRRFGWIVGWILAQRRYVHHISNY